jgi:succinate dehydrogenase flavin-adding protein (antitoxin of CptAB toxin-antitoxin module)
MNNNITSVIEKVLTLIGYQEDKNTFTNQFLDLCMQKSLSDYMEGLPETRKVELQRVLQESDPEKLKVQIEPYVATEEFAKIFNKNVQDLLQDYFRTIMPTLSEEQKNSLDTYFTSLKAV